jgi:ComF family protein
VVIASHARRFSSSLLDFIYPLHCLGCELWQAPGDRQALCGACIRFLQATPGPLLAGCANCSHRPDGCLERVLADFSNVVEAAIHSLKFNGIKKIGPLLGRQIGASRELELQLQLNTLDLLVPVPLHPARQRERGFNQAQLIGMGLSVNLEIPVDSGCLHRHRSTVQQARLEAGDRLTNTQGAFRAKRPPNRLAVSTEAGTIGLVDDVATTGATLAACSVALKQQTDARIVGIAVASLFRSVVEGDATIGPVR